MSRIELPETMDGLYLVLENERSFYDTIQNAIKAFANSNNYVGARNCIFSALRSTVRNYESNGSYRIITSKVVDWAFERYAPHLLESLHVKAPQAFRAHVQCSCDSIRTLIAEERNISPGTYMLQPTTEAQHPTTQQRDQSMNPTPNAPAVEVKTFIFGRDSASVSDPDVFNHIATLEAQIAALDKIQNKPKKLVAQIEALRADIKKLVEFSDSRT